MKTGGGVDTDELTATVGDILKGKTALIKGNDEPATGTLELTGNSGTGDVLTGKTFFTTNPKSKQTGTMPHNGAMSGSLNCGQSKSVPAGYTTGGTITANSLSSQTSATATAAFISSGKTAWTNGSKITGTLATQGGSTTTPGTTNKTIVTATKHVTGNIVVAGNSNLIAGNIKKGVNIFGVTGTWEGYVATVKDLYKYGSNNGGFVSANKTNSDYSIVKLESNQIYIRAEGDDYWESDGDGDGNYYSDYNNAMITTNSAFNLTGYNTITATFNIPSCVSMNNKNHFVEIGVMSSKPGSAYSNPEASNRIQGTSVTTGNKTLALNISSINAARYITFRVSAYAPSVYINTYIYQISLS